VAAPVLHVRGRGLPDEQDVEWWIADGILRKEPVHGAETIFDGGWVLPGLVDAHCHVGLGPHGEVELDEAIAQAQTERDAGALLLRERHANDFDRTGHAQRDGRNRWQVQNLVIDRADLGLGRAADVQHQLGDALDVLLRQLRVHATLKTVSCISAEIKAPCTTLNG
jgi:hypothetical protein